MIKGLPDKLKTLRQKYNLSQRQVADRVGISPSIVSAYETGERTPSTEILLALARLYHCSPDYLLGNDTQVVTVTLDTTGISDEQFAALQSLINTMKGSG